MISKIFSTSSGESPSEGSSSRRRRGLAINAVIGRPTTNRADIPLKLAEVAPGRYEASAGTLEAGAWLLAFEARVAEKAEDPVYRARRRMWLKP